MSKADNAFTILPIVANCFVNLTLGNMEDESLSATLNLIKSKINLWPVHGDYEKIKRRALNNCKQIEYVLESSALLYNDHCCAARLAQYLLIELRDCTENKEKLSTIDEILESVNGVMDCIDQQENNYAAMTEADRLVSVIKKQIGMD